MDERWSFAIQQGLVFLGILSTVGLAFLARTGPRQRVENIKLATETAQAVEDAETKARLKAYISTESLRLDRSLHRSELRNAAGSIAAIVLGLVVMSLQSNWTARGDMTLTWVIGAAAGAIAAIIGFWRQLLVVRFKAGLKKESETQNLLSTELPKDSDEK